MKFGSRKLSFALICYCTFICIASITRSLASSSPNDLLLLGVAPRDYKFYEDGFSSSAQKVKCKDGLKQFTKSQFNDDFCDCSDGSDEPGTSACPNGKFYCKNAGHVPLSIFSSRVNDGICDCCDGSDEYDGKVKCTNTCWESGKAARDKLKKKIATYQQGATIRTREVEQAKVAFAREEAELSKLKNEEKILKGLVEQLKDRKEQIEKAEEKERLQKEKADKERKEAEEKERLQKEKEEKERTEAEEEKHQETSNENEADISGIESTGNKIPDPIDVLEDSSSSQDVGDDYGSLTEGGHAEESQDKGAVKDAEVEADHPEENSSHENHATEDPESLSREELGRRIASRWTREKTEEETKDSHADSSSDHENSEHSDETNYEDDSYESDDEEHKDDNYDTDSEEHTKDVHDEDHSTSSYNSDDDAFDSSDLDSSSSPSWLEKIRQTVRTILNSVSYFQGPVDLSEAEHVRKEYDESNKQLSKIQSRISSLTKKLKQDFGPEKQFYSFYGQCFEIKQNKYVYKICPFKEASQVEGYSTTRLGNWDKFEDSYRTMQFSNGEKCWNGPDRSLKVKLRCGLKNEATDVDEPSRCEYLALLATPAVCHEDKLKELEDKLEMMNTENQHQTHDEL